MSRDAAERKLIINTEKTSKNIFTYNSPNCSIN